jgi:hypothetical protein
VGFNAEWGFAMDASACLLLQTAGSFWYHCCHKKGID